MSAVQRSTSRLSMADVCSTLIVRGLPPALVNTSRSSGSAITAASKVLQEGDLLAIFPEGGITRDGTLQEFKGGIMKILERQPVPVIPMALTNLWGSFFSRVEQGTAMARPFRRGGFSRVGLNVGAPIAPASVRPEVLQAQVAGLLAQTT